MWMDYWGGPKGMLALLSNYWGSLASPAPPTSSYAYGLPCWYRP